MRPPLARLARPTLAGQFLALQLVIVVVVLFAVAGVSLAQADAGFRRTEGRRMQAVAETAASMDTVRVGLRDQRREGILQPTAEGVRSLAGADHLVVARSDRRALTAVDPRRIGREIDMGDSDVLDGRSWTGVTDIGGRQVLAAHVPVIGKDGDILGFVAAGRDYPGPIERLATAAPTLLVYLGIASVLGVAGSLLLARRVKRQTLGLEPGEITRLAEHREAMLRGIKEGVLGLDAEDRVTLVNDTAAELLRLPPNAEGRRLADLGVAPDLVDAFTDRVQEPDRVVLMNNRLVTLNRMPLYYRDRPIGSVTTMRDRTALVALRHELDASRTSTEALRAQAHEFSNRLHVIAGLLELEEYEEVGRYVNRIGGARARLTEDVASRVVDPSVAALLIAKASLAAEQGSRLLVSDATDLGLHDEGLSSDLVTVVGNLVDNALDAIRGDDGSWVEVELTEEAEGAEEVVDVDEDEGDGASAETASAASANAVRVRVRDSGAGVPTELAEQVFRTGFSTKGPRDHESAHSGAVPGRASGRGVGLALVRLVCARRGGGVDVTGSEFTARLPYGAGDTAADVGEEGSRP
ncbi:histidine kinase [Nocardiopsis gilva YIM 90087]|uniref:histidine kinase n=1 Tax=Nocardiopsis gilva YIM 90087 TaxID=1235441 RepID=A0A223SB91_9ACTN|nr:ATP-binding protein [Nocardiopsis gilva]ASU85417.1 histidine kinase [Nocardiopsis gilva YIM 90087]